MMKKLTTYLFLVTSLVLISCTQEKPNEKSDRVEKYYTCPMHPQIVRDHPGKCPICGMELVEKTSASHFIDTSLGYVLQPVNEYVLSAQATLKPKDTLVRFTIPGAGVIDYDLQQTNTIAARVSGRIEHLYVKSNFQPVKAGEKLMDIYSKELVTAEQDYLLLLENDSSNHAFIDAAENKLQLLGLTDGQLEEIKKTKKPIEYITVYSSYSGHLHEETLDLQDPMQERNTAMTNLRVGMYVQKGQTLFRIYNTQSVWAVLNSISGNIKSKDTVMLHVEAAEDSIQAVIEQEEPQYRPSQTTTTFRIKLGNSDNALKIGALVSGVVNKKQRLLMVPRKAVLTLGANDVVFVRRNNFFIPTRVQTGFKVADLMEIVNGISANDQIARNAQMLVDSESFIKISSHEK